MKLGCHALILQRRSIMEMLGGAVHSAQGSTSLYEVLNEEEDEEQQMQVKQDDLVMTV